MQTFTFHLPTKIIFGRGSIHRSGNEAAQLGNTCLLVSGRFFARRSGLLQRIKENLAESGVEAVIFDQVEPNPSIETVYKGAEVSKKGNCDFIVGFGGGSAIDAAKGIAFLALNDVRLEDQFAPKEVCERALPILAIPTTCGTGSEVTKYAVITQVADKKKKTLMGLPILPRTALLDAASLDNLPQHLVAYTGFDALSHAFEALLSRLSNDITDLYATESIVTICKELNKASEGHPDSRERVFYGSMLAGIAINSTGTVIVHGMGYYLTNYHEVHHGLANAMLLPHVLRFEGEFARGKLERVAMNLGIKNYPNLIEFLEKLADGVGIPRDLSDLGVKAEELDVMVSDAMSYGRPLENNPIKVSEKEIRQIYEMAFRGRVS